MSGAAFQALFCSASAAALLLHFDGTNGATTTSDSSIFARAVTLTGTVQLSTTSPKFGSASALFAASGDATVASMPTLPGDFTIDFWVNFTSATLESGANRRLVIINSTNAIYIETTGKLTVQTPGGNITGLVAVNTGTWTHIALTRSGSSVKLFVAGTQDGSTVTDASTWSWTGNSLRIGSLDGSIGRYTGNIDEFRILNGIAAWTANFTPPTAAYV